jgi:hypothetical protein
MSSPAEELRTLINSSRRTEHECRRYLQYAKYLLMPEPPIQFCYVETERTGNLGRSDYIISGEVLEGGVRCVRACIWELKAPQCYIFERDPNHTNRLKPTQEFHDAENKLLHFYAEHKFSGLFHQQYNLSAPAPNNVLLGGIIIGSTQTKVRGITNPGERDRLFSVTRTALSYMYEPAGIKIRTWNEIQEHIQLSGRRNEVLIGNESDITINKISPDTVSVMKT